MGRQRKPDMMKAREEEQAVITHHKQRQDRERAEFLQRRRERIEEPKAAYERAAYEAGGDLPTTDADREAARAAWESGDDPLPEVSAELRTRYETAKRLLGPANEEDQAMRKRHESERPSWTEEKLDDAAREYVETVRAINRAASIIATGGERLDHMRKHGLAARVDPEVLRATVGEARYQQHTELRRLLGIGAFGGMTDAAQTPWLCVHADDTGAMPEAGDLLAGAACWSCGRLTLWRCGAKVPTVCPACGTAEFTSKPAAMVEAERQSALRRAWEAFRRGEGGRPTEPLPDDMRRASTKQKVLE